MTGVYCRVSTAKQGKDGYSLGQQEERGKAFAVSIGDNYEIYMEAKSGKKLEELNEWRRLEQDITDGKTNRVWIIDGKRLSRKLLHSLQMLETFEKYSIEFYIDGKQIDFENSSDVMMYQIIQSVAEKDGKDIVTKGTAGLHACMDAGNLVYPRLYGYEFQFDPQGKRVVVTVPDQVRAIRRIFDLYVNEGLSLRQVCFQVNREGYLAWSGKPFENSKMRRTLTQLEYIGRTRDSRGEIIKSNIYERIINDELFEQAQKLMVDTPGRSLAKKANHLCSNVLKCSKCGTGYYYHKMVKWLYYVHHNYGQPCDQLPKSVNSYLLDRIFTYIFLQGMLDYRTAEELYEKQRAQFKREKSRIEKDIEQLTQRISEEKARKERYLDAIADGTISRGDVAERIRTINKNLEIWQDQKRDFEKSIRQKKKDYRALLVEFSADNAWTFLKAPVNNQRKMLKRIIKSATIEGRLITVDLITGKQFRFDSKEPTFYKKITSRKVKSLKTAIEDFHKILAMEEITTRAIAEDSPELLVKGMRQIAGKG